MSLTPAERAICAKIAAEITEHPERWTQGVIARDGHGNGISSNNPAAVCWCAFGFIVRDLPSEGAEADIADAFEICVDCSLVDFNDARGRTASEVAAVFAKLAEAPQA